MNGKENNFLFVITYVNLILICGCIIGCMYGIATTKNVYFIIEAIVEIVALVAAITYFAMGYKKDAARYYKMFMLLQAATFIIEYIISAFMPGVYEIDGIYTAFSLVLYGNTVLLGVAKDLGKKATIGIASFNLAVYAAALIGSISEEYASTVAKTDSIVIAATWFALAGITLLMTIAKYIDKAQRKAK